MPIRETIFFLDRTDSCEMHSEAPEVIERGGSAHTAKQLYSMAGKANFRIISLVSHISEIDLC